MLSLFSLALDRPMKGTILAVLVSLLFTGTLFAAEVAVIEVGYRDVVEMLPLVETLISPDGKVSADQRTNSLVIVADAESIARVRAFLADMDKPPRQAVVRVRFDQENVNDERSLSTSGRISGDDWSVSTGGARRDGVHVRVRDESTRRDGRTEAMMRIMSGSRGYIRVGEDIPYSTRWVTLAHRYARVVESVAFQRVETGFEVRPIIHANQADIEIVPRISDTRSGRSGGVILLTEAATRITVPLDQWVTISSTDQKSNEAVRAILSYGKSDRHRSLTMSLFVSSE